MSDDAFVTPVLTQHTNCLQKMFAAGASMSRAGNPAPPQVGLQILAIARKSADVSCSHSANRTGREPRWRRPLLRIICDEVDAAAVAHELGRALQRGWSALPRRA